MADIRLTDINPSQPVQSVQSSSGSAGQAQNSLANQPTGSVVSGFVVNRDISGNPILRTESGDVAFTSNFFLKIGSEVVIRVGSSNGVPLAHILSVNGQPPEVAETQSAFTAETEIFAGNHLTDASLPQATLETQTLEEAIVPQAAIVPQSLAPAITVSGTIIAPAIASAGQPAPLPAGSQLTLNIVAITPANVSASVAANVATTTAPVPPVNPSFYAAYAKSGTQLFSEPLLPSLGSPATLSSILPQEAAVPAPASSTAQPPIQQATPGQNLAAAPSTSISPPAAPTPQNAQAATPIPSASPAVAATTAAAAAANVPAATNQPPAPLTLTATVISNDPSGEAILQTPLGVVRLQPETSLPPGSQLTLEIVQVTPSTSPLAAAKASLPTPLIQLARGWPALEQIFTLLGEGDTSAGMAAFASAMMPQLLAENQPAENAPMQNLPAGLMMFISALRGGDFSNWLGKANMESLENQGQEALLKKADSEFTAIARQFTDPPARSWQTLFFPVAVAGALQQARWFVKRERRQGSKSEKDDDTRFVVEMDLSQLGEMQLDGFVRRRDKDVQFDLVVRSTAAMSSDMQKDILQIYNDTGAITGYKGSVTFQAVKEFPVNPMQDVMAHMNTVVA